MDIERWHTLSLAEQMGNIGSEICRVRRGKEHGDASVTEHAFVRALDLIDATIADVRWQGRLKEILRLREVLADDVLEIKQYEVPLTALEQYCTDFAIIARVAR